ncbi:MAG: hypothetical protein E7162_03305 [Firmicutes bacterium]|nr:hypothetical protein [Bacillota bacterium]
MEDRVDLEGFMYEEDGSFKPLTASSGNIDGALAHLRNTYMEAERNYFEKLLSRDKVREAFFQYIDCDSDVLFDEAMKIQERLETGQLETVEELEKMKMMNAEERDNFHMQKLENAEGLMCLFLAATRDKVLVKELSLTYSGRERRH